MYWKSSVIPAGFYFFDYVTVFITKIRSFRILFVFAKYISNFITNGLGRYDDVSPFIITDNKLEIKVELPNYNGAIQHKELAFSPYHPTFAQVLVI